MDMIKVNAVEEILAVPFEKVRVEIDADAVVRYLYHNKNCEGLKINIEELQSLYIKSIKKSYAKNQYNQNLQLTPKEIKKVCYVRA